VARVCMVALTEYPADTRVRREAEALVARGDEVDFVCPSCPALGDRHALGGVTLHQVGTTFRRDVDRPRDYVRRYLAFQIAATLKVLRLHVRRRYDVIHVNTMPDFLVFAALGPKLLGSKVILDVHDLMPELYASKFGLAESHWAIRLLMAIERGSVAFADRAMAVHGPHLLALVSHGNPQNKFVVLMNVPDPALFRPGPAPPSAGRFTVVYHGMVGSRHGLDVAIRAVAEAREKVPDLELRIIGDGDAFAGLRALVRELGVEDNVRLEQGLRPIEDVLPIVREASIGIVPILDDPFTRFMLPVKLLEYVALRIPVIASDTATIRAHFDETMICFAAAGDPHEVAARIIELRRDPAKRSRLGAAASRFTEEHSWDREKTTYYELVDSLVAERSARRKRRGPRGPVHPEMEVGRP
jgi:glycosyltransferase involved in cell wall biosynthesis